MLNYEEARVLTLWCKGFELRGVRMFIIFVDGCLWTTI